MVFLGNEAIRTYIDPVMGITQAWADLIVLKGKWAFDTERGLLEM